MMGSHKGMPAKEGIKNNNGGSMSLFNYFTYIKKNRWCVSQFAYLSLIIALAGKVYGVDSILADHKLKVPPKIPKVLLLGIDGLKPSAIPRVNTPVLDKLIADGFISPMLAEDTTWSGPCWATILYGVWRDRHGIYDNSFTGSKLQSIPDLFTHIETAKPVLHTARLTSWTGIRYNMPTAADEDLYWYYQEHQDTETVNKAKDILSTTDIDVLFVYFSMVDVKGHNHGFSADKPEYRQSIEKVDRQIGELLTRIQQRPKFADEDWLILSVPDHGGTIDGQHGKNRPEHRKAWLLASGHAVHHLRKGMNIPPSPVDIVPTILDHLGIDYAPGSLDGHSLLEAFPSYPVKLNENTLKNGDAEYDRGSVQPFYLANYDNQVTGWLKGGKAVTRGYTEVNQIPLKYVKKGEQRQNAYLFTSLTKEPTTLAQHIDLQGLTTQQSKPLKVALAADIWGRTADKNLSIKLFFNDAKGFAALRKNDQYAYFFRGDEYYQFDFNKDQVDDGYPADIASSWPGLDQFKGGARNIDAAVNWGNGKAYFFKGDEYIRYDLKKDQADSGYPLKIKDHWSGLDTFSGGANAIDAAINWGNGITYFFKGDEYIRFNMTSDRAAKGYPMFISNWTWSGLQVWPDRIDAAVRRNSIKSYLFKGGYYLRFDHVLNKTDDGFPKAISEHSWSGLEQWYQSKHNTELTLNSYQSIAQRFLTHTVLPSNVEGIDVHVNFSGQQQYVDNLSLILRN